MNPAAMRFTGIVALLISLLPYPLALPQAKKSKQKDSDEDKAHLTFKVPVDVVVVNATVTDKQGNPVTDLKADEFKVFEDGKPQPIHSFALEFYGLTESQGLTGREHSAEPFAAGTSAGIQPRLISIVVDDLTPPSNENYPPLIEAVKRFIESDVGSEDQVAIMSSSGRVQYLFSADKRVLREEADGLLKKMNLMPVLRENCPSLTDLQAQWIAKTAGRGQTAGVGEDMNLEVAIQETINCVPIIGRDPRELAKPWVFSAASRRFNDMDYRNRALLRSLRQHLRLLTHFEGRKLMILFSAGFLSSELRYELQDVVDQALRANVILNTVDIRGLYTTNFGASETAANVPAELFQWKQRMRVEDSSVRQDPLAQLAYDTGGVFYHNSNDLYAGIQKVSSRQTYCYVLTYATPYQKSDGRYHNIKLEVSRPGVNLSYRKGYYSPKEELTFERRRKEDILDALRAPGNVNELPVRLSYNFYQLDDSSYEVAFLTQVDIRQIQFLDEESRRRNLISVVVVALDEQDRYVDGLEKNVEFSLTPASYAELLARGFASQISLKVPPGRFKVRAVVRESTRGKVGSLTRVIEIP